MAIGGAINGSLFLAWVGTDTLALIVAAGLVLMILTPLLALSNLGAMTLGGPRKLTVFAGRTTSVELELERRAKASAVGRGH